MPRLDAEPARKQSLMEAAVMMIGEQGSLDVSVKQIAKRAGMSSGLAFHYFGDKDTIIAEAMRFLLRDLTREFITGLKSANTPAKRIDAIIQASFGPKQFEQTTINAWLAFYAHARRNSESARLLSIYTSRLNSNLLAALKVIQPSNEAFLTATMLAAQIDGLYLRHALRANGPDSQQAVSICRNLLESRLNHSSNYDQAGKT